MPRSDYAAAARAMEPAPERTYAQAIARRTDGMQDSWWDYRKWRFLADMNGDGIVSVRDVPHWAAWLFYLPGDAFIALFGTTRVGVFLELTPTSFGGSTSAMLSVALWLLAVAIALYLPRLFVDIVDPTSRQQRRERREARRDRKRQARLARRTATRPLPKRQPTLRYEERREPRF